MGNTTVTAAAGFTNAGRIRIESQDQGWAETLNVSGLLTNNGTIDVNIGTGGSRTISADLVNNGTLNVNQTLSLARQNGSYTNQGQINIAAGQKLLTSGSGQAFTQGGGTLAAAGSFEGSSMRFNFNGGTLSGNPAVLRNASLSIGAGSAGAGSFVLSGSASLSGDIAAGQSVWVRGDNSVGNTTVTAATGFTNAGEIRLESQDQGWASNLTVSSGILTNTGTVDVNLGSGGSRNFTGSFSNQGTMGFQIAGVGNASRLGVSWQAALSGTLSVSLLNGFAPSLGQTFQILGYGSHTGTFTTLQGTDLGGGLRLDPSYGATGLTLTVVTP